ncbi:PREDICTED: DNA ligase 4 isoform X2 [Tarenaya hassleriana]|uniref:DNA ligase 4 isoform X2 n=1 Tax=Tarenaya hassleriana TaxID=28532 RepID=UPI00053C51FF|nr:PREDICTED: DNA ligase 4 isoform X2 [Tarenaya hassleriana]
MTEEVKFNVLVSLFNWIQKSKTSAQKRSKFRKFLDTYCKPSDYFAAVRLILPSLDRERGSYGLKESVLATCLIDALGISRDSPDAVRLVNWRKGGTAKAGANAGNFALISFEVLQRRQGMASGGLTIMELNDSLDRLASSENRADKTSVLSTLIQKTNAQEMKWIIMIILKDLKLGMSEKSIFQEFHPDAEDLFNVTCDLKLVCEKLRNRHQRHKRQDIEVGKAVRPQLAMRISDVNAAWKKLHGKSVVAECKFDGDRIQIHKNGTEIHYFSRNFLDHSEYAHAMSDLIVRNIEADKCILDGEMLVWDASLNRFAEFGSNQEIAKAAREGLDSHRQLCYVAFDVLYVGDTSVIHQSLKERHELLRKVVKPLKGRLEVLVPDGGLNAHRPSGEPCWSIIAHAADDVEKFFKETVENRDEGIVLKDLDSKWEPGDRSGKWLKLKPEYIRAGADLDVLIIGGYYGSGRRGGEVAQFLVALAERPEANVFPRRFISFCRVGTGLSDDELGSVVSKLKPYFRKNEYPKKVPPSFYQVTNHSKERPDVWIESPEKSIILSVTSDIRTIRSEVFAAPYSLRFPRIDRVRYDKPWHECLDVQSFVVLVNSSNGTTQKQKDSESTQDKQKVNKSSRREKKNVPLVPSQFIQTDVSDIKGKSSIFSNMVFYFVNVPSSYSLDALHKMVVENGGKFSMNLNNSVTHCIAAESSGIKYQAAKRQRDVIHLSWLLDSCSWNKLLPLQPRYFLHLTDASRTKLQDEIDEFSDSYYWDLDLEGIKQVLNNARLSDETKAIDYYKKKFCPEKRWSVFFGCGIYFHPFSQSLRTEEEALLGLTARRLALEVLMGGGEISNSLAHATHIVVLGSSEDHVDFDSLMKSVDEMEKRLLLKKGLHVVSMQWLEESLQREQKLIEDTYSLRPSNMVESETEESDKPDQDATEVPSCGSAQTGGRGSSKRAITRPRERPAARTAKRGRSIPNRTQRVQTRRSKQPSKIGGDETEENESSEESEPLQRNTRGRGSSRTRRTQTLRRGKKPSKIGGDESGENDAFGEKTKEETAKEQTKTSDETADSQKEDQESLLIRHSAEGEASQDEGSYKSEIEMKDDFVNGENIEGGSKREKVEIIVDPVQAMLMNMFPSLAPKSAEETSSLITGKPSTSSTNANPSDSNLGTETDDMPPVKKKKVSYRDVAGELLKDW